MININAENGEYTDNSDSNAVESHIYGLCPKCDEPNTGENWCQRCNTKQFQQDFPNWTSGNKYIDNFIQEIQLNAQNSKEILEWIPYDRLKNIKYLAKGGFSTVYTAIWLDGPIQEWNYDNQQWERQIEYNIDSENGYEVVIKSLNKSSNMNDEFLNEVS